MWPGQPGRWRVPTWYPSLSKAPCLRSQARPRAIASTDRDTILPQRMALSARKVRGERYTLLSSLPERSEFSVMFERVSLYSGAKRSSRHGFGAVAVAERFPEAGPVLIQELNAAEPLHTLQAYRSGMTARSGPPCSGDSGSPSWCVAITTRGSTSHLSRDWPSTHLRHEAPQSERPASRRRDYKGLGPTAGPGVPSDDQRVTQCRSPSIVTVGRSCH